MIAVKTAKLDRKKMVHKVHKMLINVVITKNNNNNTKKKSRQIKKIIIVCFENYDISSYTAS